MTREEQEKMRQGVEKKRETKSTQGNLAAKVHGGAVTFGIGAAFLAHDRVVPGLTADLAPVSFSCSSASSLPLPPGEKFPVGRLRHRVRQRALLQVEKSFADMPKACSAWLVSGASPYARSRAAVATQINTMTEQRRCRAA